MTHDVGGGAPQTKQDAPTSMAEGVLVGVPAGGAVGSASSSVYAFVDAM